MTAYIDIRGPNRELQLPIRSSNSCNSFDSCNSCLKGVILHEGDSIENGNYFGIFSKILFDNTDNNTFDIETIKRDPKKLKLINEAYLLLFEKNEIAPRSTPSTPLRPHSPAESMEGNYQETEATTDR